MSEIRTNSTVADIRRAMLMQQHDRYEELKEDMAKHFWSMIGTANQVAFVAIDDAVDMMREAGMLKQQQKQKALRALEEYHRYERNAYEHFQEVGMDRFAFWQDFVGRAADKLQPDVQRLYFAIKNVIDRSRVRHSEVLAQIQTGVALVTLSTLMFDTMADQYQRKTMADIRSVFRGGRLTAVERNWMEVGDITGRQVMQDVNLKDDPACQLGINVILTRYQSADFMNVAASEALRVNPAICEGLTEEDRLSLNV